MSSVWAVTVNCCRLPSASAACNRTSRLPMSAAMEVLAGLMIVMRSP